MAAPLFANTSGLDFEQDALEPDHRPPDNRRGARQVALQTLYWGTTSPGDAQVALRELNQRFALSEEVRAFAAELVRAIDEHQQELEELIATTSTHWKQDRMARIDWIILRLALVEMLYFADIPVRVSIDEAIELAKIYSTERSHAFINGILDAVARQRGLAI